MKAMTSFETSEIVNRTTEYLNKEYLNVCKNSCAKFNFSTINITLTILSHKARAASEKILKNIRYFCNVSSII
jgi:hypothetical protein